MMNILLISETYIRENSNLNDNVFGKWILPAIRESQEMGLMPIIGECLYTKICELVENGLIENDLYAAYKDLLDGKIQPYLLYQTLTNIVPILNGKMANIGTVATNDEHIVTLSQGELDLTQNYYRERADFYAKRLQAWVKANEGAFPELTCSCGNMKPNLERANNSVGIWLGGRRGKKLSDGKCGCSSTQVENSGYSDGYSDGYTEGLEQGAENQKELVEEITITENGDYENENGYSPIHVNVSKGGNYDDGYNDGYVSGFTDGLSNCPECDYTEAYESGYTSGYTDGYDSGSTAGYIGGLEDGKADQKALLTSMTATTNGLFEREDGWNSVYVNVPSTGSSTLQTKNVTLTGVSQTITPDNGYDGMTSVGVNAENVYQSGYTSGNTAGYASGYSEGTTNGWNNREALLSSSSFTRNDTYTNASGWSSITINVPTSATPASLQEKSVSLSAISQTITPDNGFDGMSGVNVSASAICTSYYNSGYTSGEDAGYINGYIAAINSNPTGSSVLMYIDKYGDVLEFIAYSGMGGTTSISGGDVSIVSNVYTNGLGKVTFDKPVARLSRVFPASADVSTLLEIIIPEGITSTYETLHEIKSLTAVTLPTTLSVIGEYSFWNCSIKKVEALGITKINNNAYRNNPVETIILGPACEKIAHYAFAVVKTIDDDYDDLPARDTLKSIYCYAPTAPEVESYAFYGRLGSGTLYVPAGSAASYQTFLSYLPSGWVISDIL